MYPTWTSFDRRSATNPNFATPSPISISATIRANMPARAISLCVSPGTRRGSRAAKIIGEMEESGPSTRMREGPKTAYPTRQPIVV